MRILGHEITEEMLEKSGLTKSGLRYRLKSGMPLEQALINTKSTTERIGGLNVPKEDIAKAKALGISKQTIRNRLAKGMTPEQAMTAKLFTKAKGMNAGGVEIPLEDVERARKNGVKDKTLRQRILNGWSVERAITEPVKQVGRSSKYPQEFIDRAKRNGISRRIFTRRMHNGWSLEDAASIPFNKSRDDMTETEELLVVLGRMKYLNRTQDEIYNPAPLMKKLKVTWDDIEEIKC